ncbi:hypothetical protein QAD02_011068 [Eretmocerus hayati]|uniref:Uncharacterized protein n=1 Tax=Eretmocerus hayati TaxID=131215 RepID=A0ACC2NYK0_9HYME|nr:hypothetical protein QAD02_011068 [Eretmocerus hayati]
MEEPKEPTVNKHKLSIIKNLVNQQLGVRANSSILSYHTTLNALKNLKPTKALENSPTVLNKQISEIQFNNKGNLLANVYWGNDSVQIWDWKRSKMQAFFSSGHNFTVRQVNWVPADNENLLVTSGQYGDVRLMDLTTNKSRLLENSYFEDEEFFCGGFKFCVTQNLPYTVLAGSQKGKVVHIDIREEKPTELIFAKNENSTFYEICSIDLNPVKCFEFCIGSYKDIRIYDCRNLANPVQKLITKEGKSIFQNDSRRILNVKYTYNGTEILAAYAEDPIFLFHTLRPYPIKSYITTRQERDQYSFTMYNVNYIGTRSEFIVASSSMHSTLAGCSHRNNVYIWDKDSEELVHEIKLEERSWRFAAHPYMPMLAMNLDHNGIRLWQ